MKTITLTAAALSICATAAFAQQANPGAHFIENWDMDGNGSVTLAEVTEKRGDVFVTFDSDGNGLLSPEEYVAFDAARASDIAQMGDGHGMQEMQTPMQRAFNDADGDGSVSAAEFAAKSPQMFTRMDRNGDGVITPDDFGPKS